ncbi:hypothetical protein [Synechocystis salina]|uniref:Uncharacterized protein n=1 Tax=Synechocystis salina LEGE 00031 TaxID=1828736 RepID=A0ABR9VQE5_9SYNC|nr:hypothetical protein [Synechocystis salina]MBE9240332.1 hypothetical protein [Synechocystis salina LEGE 00041]MBE9253565.1 hypothetical protein [Synechocystis salina LEGE 00031]
MVIFQGFWSLGKVWEPVSSPRSPQYQRIGRTEWEHKIGSKDDQVGRNGLNLHQKA